MSMSELESGKPVDPLVRVWDRDFGLIATIRQGWRQDDPGVLTVPIDSPVAARLLDDACRGVSANLTVDYPNGTRTVSRLGEVRVEVNDYGKYVLATFVKELDYLAKVLAWSRPVDAECL